MLLPDNKMCAECYATCPSWVSLKFGIFVCMKCSGPHRGYFGKIRSIRLDVNWKIEDYEILKNIGNKINN